MLNHSRLFTALWTVAHQAPLSMGFSKPPDKDTGVGCHALLQGSSLTQGLNSISPASQVDSLPTEPPGKPTFEIKIILLLIQ